MYILYTFALRMYSLYRIFYYTTSILNSWIFLLSEPNSVRRHIGKITKPTIIHVIKTNHKYTISSLSIHSQEQKKNRIHSAPITLVQTRMIMISTQQFPLFHIYIMMWSSISPKQSTLP